MLRLRQRRDHLRPVSRDARGEARSCQGTSLRVASLHFTQDAKIREDAKFGFAGLADLKNNLSRHLTRVRHGEEITVIDRDTPVARIVPFVHGHAGGAKKGEREASGARIADLVRKGVVAEGEPGGVAEWLDDHEPIRLPKGSPSAVKVLLGMRRESTR